MAKIYVSCSHPDLQECRQKVSQVIKNLGYDDISLVIYFSSTPCPLEERLDAIEFCDLYVGIWAWCYGDIPKDNNPDQLSYSELEYQHCMEQDKDCFVFLLDGKAPWPPDFIDDNKALIKKFREKLDENHSTLFFNSAENLESIFATTLINWGRQRGDIVPASIVALYDPSANSASKTQRYGRLATLFEQFPDDPQNQPLLREKALDDENEWVRHDAISALAEYHQQDPQTLPLLRFACVNDENEWVRRDTLSLLAEYFAEDDKTLPLIIDRVSKDPHKDVRSAAIYILVQFYRNHEKTIDVLCDRAINDSDDWVRRDAVCALAENFHNAPQTLTIINERAINDSRKDVRSAAIYALVRYFRNEPKTFELLCDRALNDKSPRADSRKVPFAYVREIAINALARFWPAHPETLKVLEERSQNDPTKWLRETSKKLLCNLSQAT